MVGGEAKWLQLKFLGKNHDVKSLEEEEHGQQPVKVN